MKAFLRIRRRSWELQSCITYSWENVASQGRIDRVLMTFMGLGVVVDRFHDAMFTMMIWRLKRFRSRVRIAPASYTLLFLFATGVEMSQ